MASIFEALPAGQLFSVLFYGLLAIAALTSTISLLEVIVSYFVDDRGWGRNKAAWVVGGACFALGVPSALSLGAHEGLTGAFGGLGFLGLVDRACGTYFLTIGAMLICIFVGWKWGVPKALASIEAGGHKLAAAPLWGILVRFVCPLAILALLLYATITGNVTW